MAKPGRPSKFTDGNRELILDAINAGANREVAAQAAGVSVSTLYDWLARGERGEAGYAEFLEDIKTTDAQAEITALQDVRAGANGWQSRAWWLERRYPDRWARRDPASQEQLAQAHAAGRDAVLAELREQIALLPKAPRDQLLAALARQATKELTP